MSETLFSGGNGSKCRPFLISTSSDLNEIRNYSGFRFEQINDIDMTGIEFEKIEEFTGSYNGNYFEIKGLHADFDCMFLNIASGSLVQKIRLVDSIDTRLAHSVEGEVIYCSIEGKKYVSGEKFGGFVSYVQNGGKISRSFFIDGYFIRGGFVNRVSQGGAVEDCYVRNVYDILGNTTGGFVEFGYGNIFSCYADAVKITASNFNASGFAGRVTGDVSDSFCSNIDMNLNITTRGSYVGGFSFFSSGVMVNVACVSVNIVVLNARYIGGFVGHLRDGTIENFYNDSNITSLTGDTIIGDDVAHTQGDFSIVPFNMNDKWNVNSNIFNGKPYIRRFWEGTNLPVEENPWAVDPNINNGMPYLKRKPASNTFVKTANCWARAESIYIKTSTGWKKAKDTVKAKTPTGWK